MTYLIKLSFIFTEVVEPVVEWVKKELFTFYEDKYSRKLSAIQNLGIEFIKYTIKGDKLIEQEKKIKTLSQQEVQAIRKIKKPSRVKPNYKKEKQTTS